VPSVTFIMTIEGLLIHPIEVEISGFGFGTSVALKSAPPRVPISQFTIKKVSDKWSSFMQQASHTGTQMHVLITVVEQLADDRLKPSTYSFSNALIRNIQYSGSGAQGVMETVQFDSEGIDLDHSFDPVGGIASYKGSHKGKTK
jgi:type VI protein secretion system component Hcp